MVHCCTCLNVKVTLKDVGERPSSPIPPYPEENDDFFRQDLLRGRVDLGGIKVEQVLLLRTRNVGLWVVHRCVNCELDTHALHREKGLGIILTNKSLVSDSNRIGSLMSNENYSTVYNIVLRQTVEKETFDLMATNQMPGNKVEERLPLSVETALRSLQLQMSQFLKEKEHMMEEKIREFTEKQHEDFLALQEKARQERQMILDILKRVEQQKTDTKNTMSDSSSQTLPAPPFPKAPVPSVSTTDGNVRPSRTESAAEKARFRRRNVGRSTSGRPARIAASLDAEAMFDMEGMEPLTPGGGFLSDDEPDTDDSASHDEGIYIPRTRQQVDFARSLPIIVPNYAKNNPAIESEDEDGQPTNIADSIRAIAESLHSDPFGDLPRPRLSTLD